MVADCGQRSEAANFIDKCMEADMKEDAFKKPNTPGSKLKKRVKKKDWSVMERSPSVKRRFSLSTLEKSHNDPATQMILMETFSVLFACFPSPLQLNL